MVAGWALFAILFAFLAPIPVNTTATHADPCRPMILALALAPVRLELRTRLAALAKPNVQPQGVAYRAGLVCCIVVMSFHLAMVALPERYFDAMAMHLYIPSYISAHRAWS